MELDFSVVPMLDDHEVFELDLVGLYSLTEVAGDLLGCGHVLVSNRYEITQRESFLWNVGDTSYGIMCACLPLASWNDTPTHEAIVSFAESAVERLPHEERVAVFDNDGTLWCEKPIPIQLDFILRRFAELAEQDESLRGRQPWKAAYEKDLRLARRRNGQALQGRRR